MVISMMIENNSGRPASQDDLSNWADDFGIAFPVVSDREGGELWEYAAGMNEVGLPFKVLLDRGGEIMEIETPTEQDAERLL